MGAWVYEFGADIGDREPKALLGGKGAGLAEMTRLGIPVPPGFTITTEACRAFGDVGGRFPDELNAELSDALAALERTTGRRLGDPGAPLLLSVRSGAPISMPGMMDSVLDLGIDEAMIESLAEEFGSRRFALDSLRRFLGMYSDVVLGLEVESLPDAELSEASLERVVADHRRAIEESGARFPSDPRAQLHDAIGAVFRSWDNDRARRYRDIHAIPHDMGTAVNVQAMVFGNLGEDSGSGVVFTRNPATGRARLYGEYLSDAQGEDVVAGIRTPRAIASLEETQPEALREIRAHAATLERHFRDLQDIEITIERGKVFVLQTRNGKRTAAAAVKVAVDMVGEELLTRDEALLRVDPASLDQLLHARVASPEALAGRGVHAVARGLPASPGAATGEIVFDADEAERRAAEGTDVILVRRETSPEDIHGMKAALGIVTATGGMTSHAAVVARGLGTCCVAGVGALRVDYHEQRVTITPEDGPEQILGPGDVLTLDGTRGLIYIGPTDVEPATTSSELETLLAWADERRELGVRANADTVATAQVARGWGAEGIGLCRTEHMFFADERIEAMRAMVLAEDDEERARWLDVIAPMQRADFQGIFEVMEGLPVTVRLLDWPLHEFLPYEDAQLDALAIELGRPASELRARVASLGESNPMLGHRGVRLHLTQPAIPRMQVRAMVEAALAHVASGGQVALEIMIPVVAFAEEVEAMRALVLEVVEEAGGTELGIHVGTMIELPRACLVAGDIARHAEFFSFGTNDLTQTTLGISRDDGATFIPAYRQKELIDADPFACLDQRGVGELVAFAVERGRARRPGLGLGLCGEHGGEPSSIEFCHRVGLDYISCSPPRLPTARLAAAHAALKNPRPADD